MAKRRNPRDLLRKGKAELEIKLRSLLLTYIKAQVELETVVTHSVLSGKLGQARYREQQRRSAKAVLARVDAAAKSPIRGIAKDSYRLGARTGDRSGTTSGAGAYSRVNREAIDLLVENLEGKLGDATNTVGRRVDDVLRREGLKAAAAQIAEEESLETASDRLVRRLARQGVTAFEDRAGRQWKLETYAEMAIRTSVQEATNQGAMAAILSQGFDVVEVISGAEFCNICERFVGKLWSLTGRSTFPKLDQIPPYHGNCDCHIIVAPESIEERRRHRELMVA